jgi:hypothetical protein
MDEHRFERLRDDLLAAGIAARHVRRTLAELQSHLDAWVADAVARGLTPAEAWSQAHQALGSDADIVARFAAQPELRAWCARRPAIFFLVIPVAAFVGVGVVLMAALLAILEHWSALHHMNVSAAVSGAVNLTAQIGFLGVLPVAICAAVARLAHRQRLAPRWPMLGILVLCFLVSMMNVGLEVTGGEQAGSAGAGIGTSVEAIGPQLLRALGLASLVILPFWLVESRSRRGRLRAR